MPASMPPVAPVAPVAFDERAEKIAQLRAKIGAVEGFGSASQRPVLPFGVPALDSVLPGSGLALGGLHEFFEGTTGVGRSHAAAATLFVAAIAARLDRPILWITPARDLYPPGLCNAGLPPHRLIVAQTPTTKAVLPLVEEGLRSPALGAVVGEIPALGLAQSRRLQLAAEESGVTALMLLRWSAKTPPSAAVSRWRIASAPSTPLGVPGIGRARISVELLRCRGSEGAIFLMEAPDHAGRLDLVSDLSDRSLAAQAPALAA